MIGHLRGTLLSKKPYQIVFDVGGVDYSLANNINTHPTLKTKVAAVAFGNTVVVQALQQGFEFTYPWETSCDYVVDYFAMCSMWAKLSPIATLAPEE